MEEQKPEPGKGSVEDEGLRLFREGKKFYFGFPGRNRSEGLVDFGIGDIEEPKLSRFKLRLLVALIRNISVDTDWIYGNAYVDAEADYVGEAIIDCYTDMSFREIRWGCSDLRDAGIIEEMKPGVYRIRKSKHLNKQIEKDQHGGEQKMDWNEEAEAIEQQEQESDSDSDSEEEDLDWFTPVEGTTKLKVLEERGKGSNEFENDDGETREVEQGYFKIEIVADPEGDNESGDVLMWSVNTAQTKSSLWGQLTQIGKDNDGLEGTTLLLKREGEGLDTNYKVQEDLGV